MKKNKGNLILGIINRGVLYKSAEVVFKLYTAFRLKTVYNFGL